MKTILKFNYGIVAVSNEDAATILNVFSRGQVLSGYGASYTISKDSPNLSFELVPDGAIVEPASETVTMAPEPEAVPLVSGNYSENIPTARASIE